MAMRRMSAWSDEVIAGTPIRVRRYEGGAKAAHVGPRLWSAYKESGRLIAHGWRDGAVMTASLIEAYYRGETMVEYIGDEAACERAADMALDDYWAERRKAEQ